MKRLSLRIISLIFLPLALAGCSSLPFFGSEQAALQVNASPTASVFLNDTHVGQTPFFDDNLKAGEYTVRLQVENEPAKSWQTKVTLSAKIVTVLDRTFGETDDTSSHYLLQLEPIADTTASEISVITIPDNVIVKVDGQPEGFSPLSLKEITAGDHALAFVAPGYQEQVVNAQVREGYKLVVSSQLARVVGTAIPDTASGSGLLTGDASGSATPDDVTPTPSNDEDDPKPTVKPTVKPTSTSTSTTTGSYVTILDTGTGWLRVRSTPSSSGTELARVDVGETYPYLESSNGWYKIEYESGEEGWISGQYAEIGEN